MMFLRRRAALIASVALATISLALWLIWSDGRTSLGGKYEISAVVPSAITLSPGANVRIAGVTVGRVTDVERSGSAVRVDLAVEDRHGPFPVDTRIAVRLRSLVGENYVEVVPGEASATVPEGGALRIAQAEEYVEIDEILSVLQGETRERARVLLQDLGGAVGSKGQRLNELVEGASDVLVEGSNLAALLDDDRRELSRLVDNLGVLSRTVGTRGDELRSFARDARGTFTAIAQRDAALRSVIGELPATLRQARRTSGVLRATTGDVAPVLADLSRAIDDLDPSVRRLRPAAREGRRLMSELAKAAPPLQGVLNRLERAAGPVRATLPGLERTLCEGRPALNYLAPYAKDVTSLLAGMASGTNYYDASGHAARLYLAFGADSATVKASDAVSKLLNAGIFQGVHLTGWNPYSKPGQADDVTTGAKQSGPNDAQGTYTRVTAAC